jgi:hypothetical protein
LDRRTRVADVYTGEFFTLEDSIIEPLAEIYLEGLSKSNENPG